MSIKSEQSITIARMNLVNQLKINGVEKYFIKDVNKKTGELKLTRLNAAGKKFVDEYMEKMLAASEIEAKVYKVFPLNDDRREWYLSRIRKNRDDRRVLEAISKELDDGIASLQRRNACRMTPAEACKDSPVPNMKADEEKAEAIKEQKALNASEEEVVTFKKAYSVGSDGEHKVKIIGMKKGNTGWNQLRCVDENNALYEIGVWVLKKIDPKFDFLTKEGEVRNACELARITKVVERIIGHTVDGDVIGNAYNHLDDLDGSVAGILKTIIAEEVILDCVAVPNERWDGKKPSKQFKLLFCEQKLSDECVDEFGGFEDDFSDLPTGDEPNTVSFKDGLGTKEQRAYDNRVVEDEVINSLC